MTWGKIDDQFHAHRKAKKAWRGHPRALGLHLLALSYCAGQLTDGFVDDEFVEEKIAVARERGAATKALVDAGLWSREDDGWRINDWLDFNPSREEVQAQRAQRATRQQRWRERSRNASTDASTDALVDPLVDASVTEEGDAAPARTSPDPTYPDPTRPTPPDPPVGGRERDHLEYGLKFNAWTAHNFPGVQPNLVKHCAGLLRSRRIEPTVAALRPLVENGGMPAEEAA